MAHISVIKLLQEVAAFLDSHWNRGQVLRTIQFSSTLCSGLLEESRVLPTASARFSTLASSLSTVRTTLRRLDDIPNIVHTFRSVWSKPEDSPAIIRFVELLSSVAGLLYYPTEHLAWAADLNLISLSSPSLSSRLWNLCTSLWIISLISSCFRSLYTLWRTRQDLKTTAAAKENHPPPPPPSPSNSTTTRSSNESRINLRGSNERKRVTFEENPITSSSPSSSSATNKSRQRVLRSIHTKAALTLAQALSDLIIAIHYLPMGILWGGRLPTLLVGLFGTLSSLLGLYTKLISPHK